MSKDEQNKVYNTKGLAPNLSMPVKGDASSTTKSAVAAGTIDIRENPAQDISALSRDTTNALNELGKIFDKAKIEEQQELAAVFGEEAFRLLHNMKDDGSGRKIAAHAAIAGLITQITGNGFVSGAAGAGLNEAVINNLKGLDPGLAQAISGLLGAAAAKVASGNAMAGASAAISGTKWNLLSKTDYDEMTRLLDNAKTDAERQAIKEEYEKKDKEQEEEEAAKRAELTRVGTIPESRIVDILNKKYSGYVSLQDGIPVYRTPSVTVSSLHTVFDLAGFFGPIGSFAAGADAALFYLEGDHEAAGWAATSAIPFMKLEKGAVAIFKRVQPTLSQIEKIAKERVLLTSAGKFKEQELENGYLTYIARKDKQGKPPRDRIDWKEAHDYWLYDSPMARGNTFNETARDNKWYLYNEVHLENGKRLDSYDPVKGEIVSRKATDLEMIDVKTFEQYLKELRDKYPAGTKIRSDKYQEIDGQHLQGKQILEIPASNQTFEKIDEYKAIAKRYDVEIRFREE